MIKETKKIIIKVERKREREDENELKQSLTLITQQSKFRLQRREWAIHERRGFFVDFFFFPLFDFSSFDPVR